MAGRVWLTGESLAPRSQHVGHLWVLLPLGLVVLGATSSPAVPGLYMDGVAAGLANYGYFHHTFFVAVLGAFLFFARQKSGGILSWSMGVAIGVAPILVGWVLLSISVGSVKRFLEQAKAVNALASQSDDLLSRAWGLIQRWQNRSERARRQPHVLPWGGAIPP